MSLQPDLTLHDRYRLVSRIAIGGMGEVWKATDVLLGRDVAVKVLKSEYAEDPTFVERFRNEARHTAALSHAGIANVFDYGELTTDGPAASTMAYLVMEYVDGEPLNAILAREGQIEPSRALDIVGQAGLALQAAHDAGVIHRDVKPGNLIVRPDGTVKVTDFGIARAVDAVPLTQTGMVVGTAYYLSPEQGSGQPVTPVSDTYSLGVVTYELLTGNRPYTGDSPLVVAMAHVREPVPQLPGVFPAPVRALLSTALAKDPAERPTAGEFGRQALELRSSVYGLATTTVLPPPVQPTRAMTQVLPPVAATPVAERTVTRAAAPPQRSSSWPIWLLLGLLALAAILFFLLRDDGGDDVDTPVTTPTATTTTAPAVQDVVVPDVEGLTIDEARRELEAADLRVNETTERSDQPEGEVLDQDPEGDTKVKPGSLVTLTVSEGPQTITIRESDYVGRPFEEVRDELEALGLQVTLREGGAGGGDPGTVTRVRPEGELRPGDTVTVTYVKADEPAPSDIVTINPSPASAESPAAETPAPESSG